VKPAIKIDQIDLRILAALQQDGRITNLKLSEKVGLSPSPCLHRVKRLQDARLIRRYGAQLDANRFIRHIFAYVEITLERHRREDFQQFERFVLDTPEIISCALISGDYDYLVQFVAADLEHFHALMDRILQARLGVVRHFTHVVIKKVKDTWELPIQGLREADRLASAEAVAVAG
jgi:DNA-binding Lrp family transcriptional regulator